MIKEIVITNKDVKNTFYVDITALKAEMKEVENKIRAIKQVLHKPHTVETATDQSKLAMDLKPWATYLYCLRSALKGKLHCSVVKPTNLTDLRSPEERQSALLTYWLTNRYGYKPSFLLKK